MAPVIEVATNAGNETWGIDPSLSPDALSVDQWLGFMSVTWDSARVGILKGAVDGGGNGFREVRQLSETSWREQLTANFDDMPAFKVTDIQSACSSIHTFLMLEAAETGAPTRDLVEAKSRAAAKLDKLHARTAELLEGLSSVGKLAPTSGAFSDADCASDGARSAETSLAEYE